MRCGDTRKPVRTNPPPNHVLSPLCPRTPVMQSSGHHGRGRFWVDSASWVESRSIRGRCAHDAARPEDAEAEVHEAGLVAGEGGGDRRGPHREVGEEAEALLADRGGGEVPGHGAGATLRPVAEERELVAHLC